MPRHALSTRPEREMAMERSFWRPRPGGNAGSFDSPLRRSVAQFVGRRKLRTDWDGRRVAAGTTARYGPCGCSVTTMARAAGYVAERGGNFLVADNTGIGE